MLAFDMETRRINDIINMGAASKMNDVEFLKKEVDKFILSCERKWMIDGDNYYDYEQEINHKKRMVIGKDGELTEDNKLPNNRYCDNQYCKMVDQKVNYILSKQLTFKTDDKAYEDALKGVFDNRFHRLLKNLGKDSYNGGTGWLYPYYDEHGKFKIRKFHPYEILPFWKDDDKTTLDFVVRIYNVLGYEGETEKVFTFVEVYDTNGIHRFNYTDGQMVPDYQTYYFEYPNTNGKTIPYNWDKVPLIPFKANSNGTSLLKKCKSLQDGINSILSSFGDGMQENASGNTIIVIKNYAGTNLGEFRYNLDQYKAVKVNTVDGADGGIDKLEIEVNCENYKSILAELRKALIQNCNGYDINELKSSGSPNEMTIKSVYSDIDLDANEIETEYQASFEELLWFINAHLKNTCVGDYSKSSVEVIINRSMMVNETQIITDINNSSSLVSKKTCISKHPYVADVDAELKQIEEEQQKAMEQFGNGFVNKQPVKDEEDAEDKDK